MILEGKDHYFEVRMKVSSTIPRVDYDLNVFAWYIYTLPKTNSEFSAENVDGFFKRIQLPPAIFRGQTCFFWQFKYVLRLQGAELGILKLMSKKSKQICGNS